jgi:hypothetical protein
MSSNENNMSPSGAQNETRALLQRLATGQPLDAAAYRRIRGEAERLTEELRARHGTVEIAVELIRETRDEA